MTAYFADIARQAAADGVITAEEILSLRSAGWGDGKMEPGEADAVFALNGALPEPTPEWSDFFVEAITEFVVNGTSPKGYVSDENAEWLIARVDADGAVESLTELELLVEVLERGYNTPERLKAYVLDHIERAVLTGRGPTRAGGNLEPGGLTASEAAILRRVLFARAGDAPAAVSVDEAELLFRLKDASLGAANAPEWKRLFVQGVGNYLMGLISKTAQLDRERATDLERFMDDNKPNVARFIARAVRSAPDFAGAFKELFGDEEKRDRLGELASAEEVTGNEQAWLDGQVNADGTIDEYEQALIDFIGGATA